MHKYIKNVLYLFCLSQELENKIDILEIVFQEKAKSCELLAQGKGQFLNDKSEPENLVLRITIITIPNYFSRILLEIKGTSSELFELKNIFSGKFAAEYSLISYSAHKKT